MSNLLFTALSSFASVMHRKTFMFFLVLMVSATVVGSASLNGHAPFGEASPAVSPDDNEEIPAVQVFVPGFSVKELPVSLTNINVVRYGADGRLYALGYDGHIYVLTDTDGDGLEDKAEYWWDKEPLVSPVGMVVAEEGIYVSAANKVSLIKDTDSDGKADTEQIITSDWEKPAVYTGTTATGVDAFGIARDQEGDIFFALGAADFTRAYMVDSLGKSQYDLNSQRGTVLKVSPGSSEREIFVTGTRFPVAMAFNSEGDLFASEQEGATWLPNGNPYDELLHIQEGRHYGFPPRHPEHLPDVIDEPSVYDYKPQHQSTTGLNFNEPVNGGPVFGPAWWEGDAIVTGYSRGKIYRTKLVKTPSGYVASNDIFASLPMLTVDACVSPQGDLVVATHSGPPDWGYGPKAEGKLYKIVYTNRDLPQPVSVWASRPDQVKVAFDKAVSENYLEELVDNVKIEYGQYVEAGDRFEVLRPGYKALERQMRFPRLPLNIKSAYLSDDRHTLILNTDTHTAPETYAITLPAFADDKAESGIAQAPAIDLSYKLNGVDLHWQATSGEEQWERSIPHLDLAVSTSFIEAARERKTIEEVLQTPGRLTLKTKLDLWNMLRPDIQPESTLDYQYTPEDVTLTFTSSEPLQINAPGGHLSEPLKKGEVYETYLEFKEVERRAYDLEVSMKTTAAAPVFGIHYSTAEDARPRAFQTHRFFLPWLEKIVPDEGQPAKQRPELAGGNWSKGKRLFFGEATCGTCHSINGKGKRIGPDLSNLIYRDYESVLRDIKDPSATINPDYLAHTVSLEDGRRLAGMISSQKDSMIIRDIAGNRTKVARQQVKGTAPMSVSLMPPGLDRVLGEQKMKDLMTYLLTTRKPAEIHTPFLPPMRNSSEVNTVLGTSAHEAAIQKPEETLNILWVSGPKDHGPDEHDYPLQQERWTDLLSMAESVEVTPVEGWPGEDQFEAADVVVFYWNYPEFSEKHGEQLDRFLQRGGGLVYLHYAVDATQNPQALADRIGLAWKGGAAKFRHGRIQLDFGESSHPITKGFDQPVVFQDESYWQLEKGDQPIQVVATGSEEGKDIPLLWTAEEGKGRVFVSILGHYNWTFDDPLFRILLLRGIAWTSHQPVNRMVDLSTMGVRMTKY